MQTMLENAKKAKFEITQLTTEQKNAALLAMADALIANEKAILEANALDLEAAKGTVSDVMLDRLQLTSARIAGMAHGIRELAGVSNSSQGTGGMVTKLQAASICLECGCDMVIANGNNPENLYAILDGQDVGTRFTA